MKIFSFKIKCIGSVLYSSVENPGLQKNHLKLPIIAFSLIEIEIGPKNKLNIT